MKAKTLTVVAPGGRQLSGSSIRVTGDGLAKNERYTVKMSGITVATGRASKSGTTSDAVIVPKTFGDDRHHVRVTGSADNRSGRDVVLTAKASKTLRITSSPVRSVGANRTVTFTVHGLVQGEPVSVAFRGHRVSAKNATGDAAGTYTVNASAGWSWGDKKVTATGMVDSRIGSKTVSVVAR